MYDEDWNEAEAMNDLINESLNYCFDHMSMPGEEFMCIAQAEGTYSQFFATVP